MPEISRFFGIVIAMYYSDHLKEFSKVQVNPDLGTIEWPNGADLDPDVLYSKITGEEISIFPESAVREKE